MPANIRPRSTRWGSGSKKYAWLMVFILALLSAADMRGGRVRTFEPDSLSEEAWLEQHPLPDSVKSPIEKIKLIKEQIKAKENTADDPNRDWWHLLKKGYFNPKDTTVKYSKFMKLFCDVYTWGDRVFNTYDTTYVAGFGLNWKARLALDLWTDSYSMNAGRRRDSNYMPMTFISEPYASLGAYLHFMAVSINYSIDLGKVFFNRPINHTKFEFGFNCARFNIDLSVTQNKGGTYIRRFGEYREGKKKIVKRFFPGVYSRTLNLNTYYFFNNHKYANGAAYNFSRLQKKSAGSFILGFNYAYQDMEFNFARLPEDLFQYYKWDNTRYHFSYNGYCLLVGYGYNWVINSHLLFNISALPSIGVTHCNEDSIEASANLLSLNAAGKCSLTYNLRDFFVCLIAKGHLQWYRSDRFSLTSGIHNLSLSIGVRF